MQQKINKIAFLYKTISYIIVGVFVFYWYNFDASRYDGGFFYFFILNMIVLFFVGLLLNNKNKWLISIIYSIIIGFISSLNSFVIESIIIKNANLESYSLFLRKTIYLLVHLVFLFLCVRIYLLKLDTIASVKAD